MWDIENNKTFPFYFDRMVAKHELFTEEPHLATSVI